MELEHVVMRRLEYHSGTRENPGLDILVQTKKEGMPMPYASKLKVGQTVWLKWDGGPITARARISSWQAGSVDDGNVERIRELTRGTGLFKNSKYWDDLRKKGPKINFIVIRLSGGEWIKQPIYPEARAYRQGWVYIDNEEKRKAWLEGLPAQECDEETIRTGIRFDVFRRDNFTCQYCGRKPPEVELEVDHVIPRALGGSNDISNLKTACRECNRGKGKKPLNGQQLQ